MTLKLKRSIETLGPHLVEILADLLEDDDLYNLVREWERTERGSLPSYTEALIILWQEGDYIAATSKTPLTSKHLNIILYRCAYCGEISKWSINR